MCYHNHFIRNKKFRGYTAYHLVVHMKEIEDQWKYIWSKRVSLKIIFLWRLWKFKIFLLMTYYKYVVFIFVFRCRCYVSPHLEAVQHLFVSRNFAFKVWRYALSEGVEGPFIQYHQTLSIWWSTKLEDMIKPTA